ncbi:MAG TPA: hypothetical protein VF290_07825 [Pyrinomonadaceae bacterium]
MRYIDKDDIRILLPGDWDEKADAALRYVERKMKEAYESSIAEGKTSDEVEKAVKAARTAAIQNKSDLWSYAGHHVKSIMHEKCWYCETKEVRSDMPVDHFRPKNSVAECPTHPGYWWLAFHWENYRYSCTFCNSRRVDVENQTAGGKQDHFPIIQPPAWAGDPDADWQAERPVLLDPTNLDDVSLLTYHENGYPRETCQDETADEHLRARQSIYFYHLDHIKAVRARKILAVKIRDHVENIDRLERLRQAGQDTWEDIKYHKREIIKLIREKAAFCTAAKIYLQGFRDRDWVKEILDRDL